jgi:CheY-like chemotaxis protein
VLEGKQMMRVLLVEDESIVRLTLRDFLENAKLEIIDVSSAEEVLAMPWDEMRKVSVLVTDLDLGPGMDGLALASELRRRLPGLPVVYATASPERLGGRRLHGWERLFAKPFDAAALVVSVCDLLEGRHRPSKRSYQAAAAPCGMVSSPL